ncbi:MAG: hypothetical protein DMF44_14375 [Verrucomicrobia bacterium]|nr:MAG: hypothetical protein DMF44_14375 [Verrucomicrobiota bacterium]
MTLAWLQLSYRQSEAYSFSTETAIAFITAKIVASFRDTACCHRNRRFQLQKAVTFYLCARTVYFSAIGTEAFYARAALESLLWCSGAAKSEALRNFRHGSFNHHANSLQTDHSVTS